MKNIELQFFCLLNIHGRYLLLILRVLIFIEKKTNKISLTKVVVRLDYTCGGINRLRCNK